MSLAAALALSLAAPASCAEAFEIRRSAAAETLPGRVDGASLTPARLMALRRERSNGVILVVGGSLAGADFRGARLHDVCFAETDLTGSDWRGADAPGVGFSGGGLARANLSGARMARVLFDGVNLEHVDARSADWSGGRLEGGWRVKLTGLVLDRARLRDFRFACGSAMDQACAADGAVSLRRADLSGATVHGWWFDADFTGARIDGTEAALNQIAQMTRGTLAGPLILRGGNARAELAPEEVREAVAAMRPAEEWVAIDKPSFDCRDARTRVERLICSREGSAVWRDDVEMASIYRRVVAADPSLRAEQRAWIRARDRCAELGCVARAYLARTDRLRGRLGPPGWLRPGTRAAFVEEQLRFDDAFRETGLYRRMLPAIFGGAASRLIVAVHADGTIDAHGDATGGNAHMCSVGGERLRFDSATGWYSGPWSSEWEGPPDATQPPMRVVRLEGDRAEVLHGGRFPQPDDPDQRRSDYMQCGARAGFERMIGLPVDGAEYERLRETLGTF